METITKREIAKSVKIIYGNGFNNIVAYRAKANGFAFEAYKTEKCYATNLDTSNCFELGTVCSKSEFISEVKSFLLRK